MCPECGDAKETIRHFLIVCPKYKMLRDKMKRKVDERGIKEERLLEDHRRIKHIVEFNQSINQSMILLYSHVRIATGYAIDE
jgi:hypothetical protein